MRYLILSDVHANYQAIEAVFEKAEHLNWQKIICLGDLTGYNAEPNKVVNLFSDFYDQNLIEVIILGNHDNVVLNKVDPQNFNEKAKFAALWHRDRLSQSNKIFLDSFGPSCLLSEGILAVHGSPADPDEYLTLLFQAEINFQLMAEINVNLCFNGHTHIPCVFKSEGEKQPVKTTLSEDYHKIILDPLNRYIINPGSTGQPRDGNPKASFGLYDTETNQFELFRAPYNYLETQKKIISSGLPPDLADRLALGF
jgi:predicted phosphodiesterase